MRLNNSTSARSMNSDMRNAPDETALYVMLRRIVTPSRRGNCEELCYLLLLVQSGKLCGVSLRTCIDCSDWSLSMVIDDTTTRLASLSKVSREANTSISLRLDIGLQDGHTERDDEWRPTKEPARI